MICDFILEHVFAAWATQLHRLVGDHLEGGQFHDYSETGQNVSKKETKSVVKHNKLCEELFAHLDRLRTPHSMTPYNHPDK